MIVFTEFRHLSLTPVQVQYFKIHFHILPPCKTMNSVSFVQVSLPKPCMHFSSPPYMPHVLPSCFPSTDHPNNILWGVRVRHHHHSFVCITTGPLSLPKSVLHTVRCSVSSSNFHFPLFSLRYEIYEIKSALISEIRADQYHRTHAIIRCRIFFFQCAIQDTKIKIYRINGIFSCSVWVLNLVSHIEGRKYAGVCRE